MGGGGGGGGGGELMFWVAKIKKKFGCLKFLIFFRVSGRCWARPYVRSQGEPPPPALTLSLRADILHKNVK